MCFLVQEELKHLEAKLINLQNDVQLNANIVHDLKAAVKGILGSQENVAAAISGMFFFSLTYYNERRALNIFIFNLFLY